MTSTIQQRREATMNHVYQLGHVSVRQLAEDLGVSEATVRRDLHGLAAEGLLELTHGGASVIKSSDYSFISKSRRNIEAKRTIAKLQDVPTFCKFAKGFVGDATLDEHGTSASVR